MSSSTYFRMITRTVHSKPISELEYLLYKEWDVWNVTLMEEKYVNDDNLLNENTEEDETDVLNKKINVDKDWHQINVFKVFIYELDEEESKGTIESVLALAESLNINLEVRVIDSSLSKQELLNLI